MLWFKIQFGFWNIISMLAQRVPFWSWLRCIRKYKFADLNFVFEAIRQQLIRQNLEDQRRSFVYGNLTIDNPKITPELVNKVADNWFKDRVAEPGEGETHNNTESVK